MQISIRYFAALREVAGGGETLDAPERATVADLRALLANRRTDLVPLLSRCAVSVNRAYATDETTLHDGDEVAFLPPVGGG